MTECQWLPYLDRCRCGWRPAAHRAIVPSMLTMAEKKVLVEAHLGRPVNKNEIIETKVSILL